MNISYRYDPLDRLISCFSGTQPISQRFYGAHKLATEIQETTHCSFFSYGQQVLAQQRQHSVACENTLLASDTQGSVMQIINPAQHHTFIYTPYGHQPDHSGLISLLGFNGEYCETQTGHYLLGDGHRAFNPVLMRFNSPDPMSPFEEGGINAYAYCKNDPINWNDPSGNIRIPIPSKPTASLGRITPLARRPGRPRPAAQQAAHTENVLKNIRRRKFNYAKAHAAKKRGDFKNRVSVYTKPTTDAEIDQAYLLAREAYNFKVIPSPNIEVSYQFALGHPDAIDTSAFDAVHIYLHKEINRLNTIPIAQRASNFISERSGYYNTLTFNKQNRLIHIHHALRSIRQA